MQETLHPSSIRPKLLSDILLHSLDPAGVNSQLDLRDTVPDMLVKDMSSSYNLTQSKCSTSYRCGVFTQVSMLNVKIQLKPVSSYYFFAVENGKKTRKLE